ncbi:uncharacterized protein LOC107364979, partial [Tetranychus urticae]|uniref:uncharacterized protein LOC107364979 n=1 Tax=Tetranychus urticae TaxID=32264 RepID=UPI00077BB1E0
DHSLLLEKASLPYEYLDTWDKFEDDCLPPIDAFNSTLTGKNISEEIYLRLKQIWVDFECKNLGDFHDIYLQLDVALLTAIFENFRSMSLREFGLDPTHFWSTPGLTWAAAIKFTEAEIDHINDIDMVLMIEKGIRGGISSAMKRHAVANNPLCPEYNEEEPNSFITYLDVNNLVEKSEYQSVLNEITSDKTKHGYIIEVDLDYPKELHDWHDDYPLAPETISICENQLSDYQTKLVKKLESCGNKRLMSPKLIPNLFNKIKYVTHYRNLRYYMSKGLLLKKIHRILQFEEKPWLKPYIMLCTEKRQQANNAFEKDFWKLMINSLYGKSIENKRKHCEVKFLADRKAVFKATREPLFDQFCILDENRAIAKLRKSKVILDKPIAVGFSVLEFAKLYMYQLHYDTFKAYYGRNLSLVYTDTDSFIYHIKTENLYNDLKYFANIMDFCDYPKNHSLHSEENKKKLGYLKDETNGDPIIEIIALKSKMYLIRSVNSERKTAKGVQKHVVKSQILQDDYLNCLYDEKLYKHTNHRLQSKNHKIKAISTEKISLSPLDDKRWAIDNVNTHAFGHYQTTHEN